METTMLRSYKSGQNYWWFLTSVSLKNESGVRKNGATMEIHDSEGAEYYLPAEGKDGDYCEVWQGGYHAWEGWWRSSVRAEWRGDRWIVSNCEDEADTERVTTYLDWEVRRVADGVQKTPRDL